MRRSLIPILLNNPNAGTVIALGFVSGSRNVLNGKLYGTPTQIPGWTFTRTSQGYAQNSPTDVLRLFATGIPRITAQGILIEQAATNVVLWCRDLTNVAWVKLNVTAALDQTGADGTANAATSLTATAGNGTVLQAIVLGSSARLQSAWVKRITGSGAIQMTTDNGATWTAITVTAGYTQLSIPTQTLANPTVGFRIVTSGDAIAVDFVQNETGTFATSPILTTSASATRGADVAKITGGNFLPTSTFSVVSKATGIPFSLAAPGRVWSLSDGTANNVVENYYQANAGVGVTVFSQENAASSLIYATQLIPSAPANINAAISSASGVVTGAVNGGAPVAVGTYTPISATTLTVGNTAAATRAINAYIRSIAIFSAVKNTQAASTLP